MRWKHSVIENDNGGGRRIGSAEVAEELVESVCRVIQSNGDRSGGASKRDLKRSWDFNLEVQGS